MRKTYLLLTLLLLCVALIFTPIIASDDVSVTLPLILAVVT